MADLLAPPAAQSTLQPSAPTVAGAVVGGQSNMGFGVQAPDYGNSIMLDGLALLLNRPRAKFNPSIPGFVDFDGYALPQGYKSITPAEDPYYGEGGDLCTTYGGTPLFANGDSGGNFLGDNGADPSTWQPGYAGRMVRRFIGLALTEQNRQQIPAIVWIHTESDSQIRDGFSEKDRFKAATRRWFSLMRTWIGKTAAQLPVFVALPMPYSGGNGTAHRMIRQAYLELSLEPAFNFHIGVRQTADADPRYGSDYSHIDTEDLRAWFRRAAYALAKWFAGLYGSPVPEGLPSSGPVWSHAYCESATTTIVTCDHDRGDNLRLGVRGDGSGAADARGWSFIDGGMWRGVQSCERINARQIRISHDARTADPMFCEVGYCLYGERLFRDGGIYDNAASKGAVGNVAAAGPEYTFDWPAAGMFTPLVPSDTPFGGTVITPPVDPPPAGDTGRIDLSIVNIGTLYEDVPNAGVAVEITVETSADITSLSWVVYRRDFSWRGEATVVATTGSVVVLPRFFAAGDTFKIFPTGNEDGAAYTEAAIAVIPPSGRFLSGAPGFVGELVSDGSGAEFAFTIQSGGGVSRLEWVLIGPAPDYFWDGFSRVIAATGVDRITVRFTREGEFFECWDPDSPTIRFRSDPVSLTVEAPSGAALEFLSDPGTLYEAIAGAGASWTFNVGTNGLARLGVVVVNPDYSWTDGGQVITLPSSGSHVTSVTVRFTRSGQFVKIYNPDDFDQRRDGSAVLLAVAPPTTGDLDPAGLAFAKNWFNGCTLSHNPERAWAWAIPGGIAAAAAYWKVVIGITDIRLFYPYRPAYDMNGEGRNRPTKAQFARILDATAQYVSAGLKVRLFIGDVWTIYEDLADPAGIAAILAHVTDCAAWIAERNFDPNMVCIGVANELGGDSDFVALQQQWHAIMRAALPGYLLACGANYWQAWTYLVASTPWTTDRRTYWPTHIYEAHNAIGWLDVRNQLRAWSQANGGLVIAVDEWGGHYSNESSNPAAWLPQIDTYWPAMDEFYTSLWAITYGSEWRWNAPNSYKIAPMFEAKLIAVAKQIAINLGTPAGGGGPTTPLPPGAGTITVPTITINLPGIGAITVPAGSQLVGLFHDLVNPGNKAAPILLTEAVGNAQDDLGLLTNALTALAADTNAAVAYLAANAMPLPAGPLATDAAAAVAGIPVGGSYFDAAGIVHRRLA